MTKHRIWREYSEGKLTGKECRAKMVAAGVPDWEIREMFYPLHCVLTSIHQYGKPEGPIWMKDLKKEEK